MISYQDSVDRRSPRILQKTHAKYIEKNNEFRTLVLTANLARSLRDFETSTTMVFRVYEGLLDYLQLAQRFTTPQNLRALLTTTYGNINKIMRELCLDTLPYKISATQIKQFKLNTRRIKMFIYTLTVHKLAILRTRLPNGVVNLISDFYL